jgi:hypothetical protein
MNLAWTSLRVRNERQLLSSQGIIEYDPHRNTLCFMIHYRWSDYKYVGIICLLQYDKFYLHFSLKTFYVKRTSSAPEHLCVYMHSVNVHIITLLLNQPHIFLRDIAPYLFHSWVRCSQAGSGICTCSCDPCRTRRSCRASSGTRWCLQCADVTWLHKQLISSYYLFIYVLTYLLTYYLLL